ncbi:MAG: hypothetical protein Q4G66_10515 [bacterium]|nr:hypothetical protein [bacterium]
MIIPKHWACERHEVKLPDGAIWPLRTWGWGENEEAARQHAAARAEKVRQRILQQGILDPYEYGDRPLREEIVETIDGAADEGRAVITRNRYGALILNSSSLLFLDIDQKVQKRSFLSRLVGRKAEAVRNEQLLEIKEQLVKFPKISFRLYQTAAGFRVIATNRAFKPLAEETSELMLATNTDQLYQRLCLAQHGFRARLTPKPWRCALSLPSNSFPRTDAAAEEAFVAWKRDYEQRTQQFATCRYIETIGSRAADSRLSTLIALHDRMTRCTTNLPLA